MKLAKLLKLPNQFMFFIITIIRPLLGPSGCCKFVPSCTQYAKQALQDYILPKACLLILKRIFSCW